MRDQKPAVFMDRDGTLILDRGYLRSPDDVVFYRQTIDALRMLQLKFDIFIISNQSGIAKGFQSVEETENVNRHIVNELALSGISVKDFYYCPHRREDNCRCMKPRPFFAHKAAADYGVPLSCSFSVGDHPHDVELANNFGGVGVYLLTGHGGKHVSELRKDVFVAKNILAASRHIMKQNIPACKYSSPTEAAKIIKRGGVAVIPTETVYGLGCNAFDKSAVETVFRVKRRPHFDPLIVHISDIGQLAEVADSIPEQALRLAEMFWPGPLTMILKKASKIPGVVTARLDTVAVRMPAHPVALKIIREAGCPVAAPSANIFGGISPTTAENADKQLGSVVRCIVDGGPCEIGIESSIVDLSGKRPKLLRPGGIPVETLKEFIGDIRCLKNKPSRLSCPGMMSKHYSPETRLVLNTSKDLFGKYEKVGRIVFGKNNPSDSEYVENLSPSLQIWKRVKPHGKLAQ